MGSPIFPAPAGMGQMLWDLVTGAMPKSDNGALEAITAWKRRGIPYAQIAERLLSNKAAAPQIANRVNGKFDFTHSTSQSGLSGIVRDKVIKPGESYGPDALGKPDNGVALSRSAAPSAWDDAPIRLTLSGQNMPATRPTTGKFQNATGFNGKTFTPEQAPEFSNRAPRQPGDMNPYNEAESRTLNNQPIPADAIQEIHINKKAWDKNMLDKIWDQWFPRISAGMETNSWDTIMNREMKNEWRDLESFSKLLGKPMVVFKDAKEMRAARMRQQ